MFNRKVLNKVENYIFWYLSDEEVYRLNGLHIHFVIDNPGIFGLKREYIDAVYDSFNEPVGTEGKARIEILKRVLKGGWVRARFNGSLGKCFIEVDDKKERKETIEMFLRYLQNTVKLIRPDDKLVIIEDEQI
jgi:hypothetical protein